MTSRGQFSAHVGVIFDLDGTLVDTLHDITDSINEAFNELDLPPKSAPEIRSLIGEGLTNLLRRASGIEDPDKLASLVNAYRRVYRDRLLNRTRLYPTVAEMLDTLSAMRVPMAVLSNKPHEFTAPICEALLSTWPFTDCRGSTSEFPRKPDPETSLLLARRMSRNPTEVVFVGDSSIDIETARNAGMVAVAVTWGYRNRSELNAAEPDMLADQPSQIASFIREYLVRRKIQT